jgi:hypothetical protein
MHGLVANKSFTKSKVSRALLATFDLMKNATIRRLNHYYNF